MDETEVMSTNVEECRTPSEAVEQPAAAGLTRKRLVASQSRGEGACNRAGDASVTFCGEEEQRSVADAAHPGRRSAAEFAATRRQRDALVRAVAAATARNIAASLWARHSRPVENGLSGAAPAVPSLDYRAATPDQREALKQRIRDAAARGQKLYP